MSELTIDGTAVEAIAAQPAQEGPELFGAIVVIVLIVLGVCVSITVVDVVNVVIAAVSDHGRCQLEKTVGDAHAGVALSQLEERPRPATTLGRCRAAAADAHRVASLGVQPQDLLEPRVMLPAIDEVVPGMTMSSGS